MLREVFERELGDAITSVYTPDGELYAEGLYVDVAVKVQVRTYV